MAQRDQKDALNSAYRTLARRAYSRRELQGKLERKKYSQVTIRAVLDELEAKKFLDDRAFAINFVRDRLHRRHFGRERVALELKNRGIGEDLIEESLESLSGELNEKALAQCALNKKLHAMKRSPNASDRRRLADFLRRRGFSFDTIRKTLKFENEIC